MRIRHYISLTSTVCLLALGACQSPGGFGSYGATPAAGNVGSNVMSSYGIVQAIDLVPRESSGIDVGTVGGALVGGLLGNQVGQGRGNTAATIAGAAGGALLGREVGRNMRQNEQVYRITVRLDKGVLQSYVQETPPAVRIGDRVRIVNNIVQSY
jgi:outer membrane lipoprotein SlyB